MTRSTSEVTVEWSPEAPSEEECFVCGDPLDGDRRLVLARGKLREAHCSEVCLRDTLYKLRRHEGARRRRRFVWMMLLAGLVVGGNWLWRHRLPMTKAISFAWPEAPDPPPPAPAPIYYGPAWPPTDADWSFAFQRASWVYPLPGPSRRVPRTDERIFGPEAPRAPICRTQKHCGVDLGGELWGEHVYAAMDGVVDRVQMHGNDARGGGYVRISHLGGMVFTQYYHLAATPRGLGRGTRVTAGEVIALLGDTGLDGPRGHLTFTLSVRPSAEFPEVFWDPSPMMASWPLRVPPRGTVAGLAPRDGESATPRLSQGR
jgi:peptidase M23-like protein